MPLTVENRYDEFPGSCPTCEGDIDFLAEWHPQHDDYYVTHYEAEMVTFDKECVCELTDEQVSDAFLDADENMFYRRIEKNTEAFYESRDQPTEVWVWEGLDKPNKMC